MPLPAGPLPTGAESTPAPYEPLRKGLPSSRGVEARGDLPTRGLNP